MKIIGEENPKIAKIPQAIENTQPCRQPKFVSDRDVLIGPSNLNLGNGKRKKVYADETAEESLDELQRDVLLLQKEYLTLKMKKVKYEMVEKASQTDGMSYVNDITHMTQNTFVFLNENILCK